MVILPVKQASESDSNSDSSDDSQTSSSSEESSGEGDTEVVWLATSAKGGALHLADPDVGFGKTM